MKWIPKGSALEHAVLLVASILAASSALGAEKREPEYGPWGEEQAGLRCRIKAPDRLEQGMPLEVEIEFRCGPRELYPGVTKLNRFRTDDTMELTLFDQQTKASVTVRPYDPTEGMSEKRGDEGKEVEPLDKSASPSWRITFPLATAWSKLKPGVYQARVRYSYPYDRYVIPRWRGTPAERDAIWKGTVVSGPVALEVLPATTQKTETLLLPRRLRLLPGMKIGYAKEDEEKVEVPRRNGFQLGTSVARGRDWPSGFRGGGGFRSGLLKPDDDIDQFFSYLGGDKKLSYTITIFETADQADRGWYRGPGFGDYRELWKKTFDLSLSEKELKGSVASSALGAEKCEPGKRPWGKENAGLRCRIKAPGRLEQGMPLEVEIEFRSAPEKLPPGVTKLNLFLADELVALTLLDPQTKTFVTVWPYDPTSGMPVLGGDEGKQVEPLDKSASPSWRTSFPLATVWSMLKPGAYQARVRYSFPGRYEKSLWQRSPAEWDAIWKGTVVSGPVALEVLPATQKTETLLLPRRLRLMPGLTIGYTKKDADKVEVPRRNGFMLGTDVEGRVLGHGDRLQCGSNLQSGSPKPDDDNWGDVAQLHGYQGGDKKLSYTITVFETSDRAGHGWWPRPGSGNYRELWKKTLDISLSEKALKESAGAGS